MIGDLIGFVFVFVHRGAAEVLVATLLGGALLSPELFFLTRKITGEEERATQHFAHIGQSII